MLPQFSFGIAINERRKWKRKEILEHIHAHNFYYLPFHVSHHHHNIISNVIQFLLFNSLPIRNYYYFYYFHHFPLLFPFFHIRMPKNVANVQTNKYACDTFWKWIKGNDCVTLFRLLNVT